MHNTGIFLILLVGTGFEHLEVGLGKQFRLGNGIGTPLSGTCKKCVAFNRASFKLVTRPILRTKNATLSHGSTKSDAILFTSSAKTFSF